MNSELISALFAIFQYCMAQNDCKTCPLKKICGKMPCEW